MGYDYVNFLSIKCLCKILKYYFGITYDNEVVARGIEIRRHDVPDFIK